MSTVAAELDIQRRALSYLASLPEAEARAFLGDVDSDTLRLLDGSWAGWGRRAQQAPPGDWRVWLMMAGRGFGKTRSGSEWINRVARRAGKFRIALVGATLDEARAVMVEGPSGILATAPAKYPPVWSPSLGQIKWRGGAIATLFSADAPEGLRGPEHSHAWCDELGKWGPRGEAAWDNLMLGLRQGPKQRVVVTTTPRTTVLLKRLLANPAVRVTRGRTDENPHLPDGFVAEVTALYGGTRLGRQELDGELIEDVEGALWTRGMIEAARAKAVGSEAVGSSEDDPVAGAAPLLPTAYSLLPPLTRIVVAVDPPASATGDACGIIAAGIDARGHGHVIADASVENPTPETWARAVARCASWCGADRVIAEGNNGGDMVKSVLNQHDPALPVTVVRASKGKTARAEPVAHLYEQGRVTHHGAFPALEDQLCGMLRAGGYAGPGRSPDRADALVWALSELMLRRRAEPRVRRL